MKTIFYAALMIFNLGLTGAYASCDNYCNWQGHAGSCDHNNEGDEHCTQRNQGGPGAFCCSDQGFGCSCCMGCTSAVETSENKAKRISENEMRYLQKYGRGPHGEKSVTKR